MESKRDYQIATECEHGYLRGYCCYSSCVSNLPEGKPDSIIINFPIKLSRRTTGLAGKAFIAELTHVRHDLIMHTEQQLTSDDMLTVSDLVLWIDWKIQETFKEISA